MMSRMGGVKRKEGPNRPTTDSKKQKTTYLKPAKASKAQEIESDEDDDGFERLSADESDGGTALKPSGPREQQAAKLSGAKSESKSTTGPKQFKLETSSAEAHAKQRALAAERKAGKPNADAIQRSKKIWERLRRKSHVQLEERKELVAELFDIITGRVQDFVFKHDSVRVIQCALKYANQQQRRQIVGELKGAIRTLAESRYGKFLVAKLVQDKDDQVRDAIIPEFYGHVKRLVNHPEASWIVDDIYRQIATPEQKAMMLREWYGAEFALFHRKPQSKHATSPAQDDSADLKKILETNPEKRKPILQHLLQMINSLIQKKLTGFTMLHDAMLQYFLVLPAGSEEHTEFLEILKGDIDPKSDGGGGDLFRNMSFTKSGSRLVCLAIAYGTAKDRKTILKCFRDTIELMAYDQHGKMVLVAALDVTDDTKMSSKAISFELLGQSIEDETQRLDRLEQITTNLNARLPLVYPLAGQAKWLFADADKALLAEIHEIRKTTSKKAPEARRQELIEYMSQSLLELIAKRAEGLVQSSFSCQFMIEALLQTTGTDKSHAISAVAHLAAGNPNDEEHISNSAPGGRMLKTLVLGGTFDAKTKQVKLVDPPLRFGPILYSVIAKEIVEWACSESSFVIVAFLEGEDVPESVKKEIEAQLKSGRTLIARAAEGDAKQAKRKQEDSEGDMKKSSKMKVASGNAGARILIEKIS